MKIVESYCRRMAVISLLDIPLRCFPCVPRSWHKKLEKRTHWIGKNALRHVRHNIFLCNFRLHIKQQIWPTSTFHSSGNTPGFFASTCRYWNLWSTLLAMICTQTRWGGVKFRVVGVIDIGLFVFHWVSNAPGKNLYRLIWSPYENCGLSLHGNSYKLKIS